MEEKLLSMAERIEELIVKLAEPTADLILNATRIDAFGNLITGIVFGVLTYLIYRKGFKTSLKNMKEGVGDDFINFMGVMILGIALIFTSILSIVLIFNVWNYVGIFYPELYLAHRLIG